MRSGVAAAGFEDGKRILPAHEARCGGRGCQERFDCVRYTRLVHENLTKNAHKGHKVAVSMIDDDGVCRRKV